MISQIEFIHLQIDQSKDLIWIIGPDFQLKYANKTYFKIIKKVIGVEKKINESAFIEAFGEEDVIKWKKYYQRALKGEYFEIEEHYYHPELNEIHFAQITFQPLKGEDDEICAVSCNSRDITRIVKQRSESNLLMDTSLDVFCILNKQSQFVYLSDACRTLWGYAPEELIGKVCQDFIFEEDIFKSKKMINAIHNGLKTNSFVNRYKKKNGDLAYNLWSASWNKHTKLMYAVAKDCKEKIQQEEKILKSEQRYKALVQGGSDVTGILDEEGNYIYVSPSSTTLLGMSPEEFIGKNALDFIHPDDVEKSLESLHKITSEKRIEIGPFRFLNNKKEWRWFESVLTNMLDDPAVNGIVANSRDITDKIKEQQKLKLVESVITNTKDAVMITEAKSMDETKSKVIYVNEAFSKITGYKEKEMIGKSPRILYSPNSDQKEVLKLENAIKNWKTYESTILNSKKNGEEFWINTTITPVQDEKGNYTHWISIGRDVTEQKRAEREKDLTDYIGEIFNESNEDDLSDCLTLLCQEISTFDHIDYAEIWLPTVDNRTMNRVANYNKTTAGKIFYNATNHKNSRHLGDGMLGHIWKYKKLEIWGKHEKKWLINRKKAADKAGILSMMGIPFIHKDEVIGILMLGSVQPEPVFTKYSELLNRLEPTISSKLSRKKTENELSQIFNHSPNIICVAGFDGYIKRMNTAGIELLGYSIEEIRSKPIKSFIHIHDRAKTREKQKTLYNGSKVHNFENRYITKSGEIVWLSWTSTSIPELGVVYAIANNITKEKKLSELNRQVRSITKIGSWEVDLVSQTLYWSDETHKIHGTDPKSFIPDLNTAIEFYREDFRQLVIKSIENCISTGQPYDFKAIIITTENKELWVRATGNVEIVNGVCKKLFGSFQDINRNKQAEIRFQSFANNLPGVAFQYIINTDGTDSMKYTSKGVEQILGVSAEKANQNTQEIWDCVTAGGDLKKVQRSIAMSIKNKEKWSCRFRYVMPTGELRDYLASGSLSFLTDGTIKINSIILDVTQETKNEKLLDQVSKIARIGSWEMDMTNQNDDTMYWSPITKQILEVPESFSPTLSNSIEFCVGESKMKIQHALDALILKGIDFDIELEILSKKGNKIWTRCIGKCEWGNNVRVKIFGSFQDITLQKDMELKLIHLNKNLEDHSSQLERSNEELEQFAFIASHDLQEPLRMISSFMDLLKRKYKDQLDEKALQYIHYATDGAVRMKQIILDLLDYSKAGKLLEDYVSIDLNEVLDEYKILRRKIIDEKKVVILSDSLPIVKSYKSPITQTIHSLLDNAIKYSKEGEQPKIEINVTEDKNEWIVEIKDNGIGIKREFFDKIFIIFQRLHDKNKYLGNGIGLSIAKKNIESCNGRIWVESIENKGSSFYFTLNKT